MSAFLELCPTRIGPPTAEMPASARIARDTVQRLTSDNCHLHCAEMPIRSFRHKGLKRLFEDDDARGVSAGSVDKLRKMLFALDSAVSVAEIGAMPGWRLHRLKGELVSMWSLTVTRNWRLVFRFEDGDAFEVDLVDYH